MKSWRNTQTTELFKAILNIRTTDEVANFCRDLMTEDEIIEFGKRFKIAQLLYAGESQRVIAKEMKVSITTVTRVNKWLNKGMGGYKAVLMKDSIANDLSGPEKIVSAVSTKDRAEFSSTKKVSSSIIHHHKTQFAVL